MAVRTCETFERLTPDRLIAAVEAATGRALTGLANPLTSYINRVYELQARDGERLIAKFYRPGRWPRVAVEEEHRFVLDCQADEIPVVAPVPLADGHTLGQTEGILFAVYPKRWGRQLEINGDEDWRRLGRLLGRLHTTGSRAEAPNRIRLDPQESVRADVDTIVDGGFVTARYAREFRDVAERTLKAISPLFRDLETIRIHGDCHPGNLLERPGEGILVIDFDDMVTGPPVQDLWMLLPDHAQRARRELDLVLDGYEEFREFDYRSLRCVEALRAMRILYFTAWCSRQSADPCFARNFPNWGDDAFWRREIADLEHQLQVEKEYQASFDERT